MGRIKARGKWVDGLAPDTPVTEAARAFLSVRLESVAELLPLAHRSYEEDIEYVHQLRVGTRRSDAALRVFELLIRPKRLRQVRKRLTRLRRAAGLARICDVHGLLFAEQLELCEAARRPALEWLVQRNGLERREAQRAIDEAAQRYGDGRFEVGVKKLLKSPRPPRGGAEPSLLELARRMLPPQIAAVREAASRDMNVLSNMHELRIVGKRLRYAMEIFAPCFEPVLKRDLYPVVEEMQEHLGELNDRREITSRVRAQAAALRDPAVRVPDGHHREALRRGVLELALDFRRRRNEQLRACREWWAQFGVGGFLDELEGLVIAECST